MNLPVAILAGGLATRLHPLTISQPKSLLPFGGVPFIEHQLHLLRSNGIENVVICAGHYSSMIQYKIGNGRAFGLDVHYSIDGPYLLGTGGALKQALPLLGPEFFVLYGDAYVLCDFQAVQTAWMETTHAKAQAKALMTVAKSPSHTQPRNVEFDNHLVWDYRPSLPTVHMNHFDYGLSIVSAAAFNSMPDRPFSLELLYAQLIRQGQLAGMEVSEPVYEIGSFQGIEAFRVYCQGLG